MERKIKTSRVGRGVHQQLATHTGAHLISHYRRHSSNLLKGWRRTCFECLISPRWSPAVKQQIKTVPTPPPRTPKSLRARLRRHTSPPRCHISHVTFPIRCTSQWRIPIYLFLHHHRGKLLCKWHTSLSLSCKYNVTADVNNPFVCLTGRLSNAARFP